MRQRSQSTSMPSSSSTSIQFQMPKCVRLVVFSATIAAVFVVIGVNMAALSVEDAAGDDPSAAAAAVVDEMIVEEYFRGQEDDVLEGHQNGTAFDEVQIVLLFPHEYDGKLLRRVAELHRQIGRAKSALSSSEASRHLAFGMTLCGPGANSEAREGKKRIFDEAHIAVKFMTDRGRHDPPDYLPSPLSRLKQCLDEPDTYLSSESSSSGAASFLTPSSRRQYLLLLFGQAQKLPSDDLLEEVLRLENEGIVALHDGTLTATTSSTMMNTYSLILASVGLLGCLLVALAGLVFVGSSQHKCGHLASLFVACLILTGILAMAKLLNFGAAQHSRGSGDSDPSAIFIPSSEVPDLIDHFLSVSNDNFANKWKSFFDMKKGTIVTGDFV